MRGWWWCRRDKAQVGDKNEKKEVTVKTLHFSPFRGATALCGVTPIPGESREFDKDSQPAGQLPSTKNATPCSACTKKVLEGAAA